MSEAITLHAIDLYDLRYFFFFLKKKRKNISAPISAFLFNGFPSTSSNNLS